MIGTLGDMAMSVMGSCSSRVNKWPSLILNDGQWAVRNSLQITICRSPFPSATGPESILDQQQDRPRILQLQEEGRGVADPSP